MKTAEGLGTQLRRLIELLDGDLEKIYAKDGLGYRPRYTPIFKAISQNDGLTIKEIASKSSISHSAASQTVAKMFELGFVFYKGGADRRERRIHMSEKGLSCLPVLKRRWQATQNAAKELDVELDYSLSTLLSEAIDKLEAESFYDRISRHEGNPISKTSNR